MKPYVRRGEEGWVTGQKESLLYNGQVLSALSKLYLLTNEERYHRGAEDIARRFREKYEQTQGYIEGEYRLKNPISNAWVVMALRDFYRLEPNEGDKNIIFELSDKILKNQITDPQDVLNHGRWRGAYSTSGIGWIAEVMSELYYFCQEEERFDCSRHREAVVRAMRWLVQNTYTQENSSFLPNPERALGGLFWNKDNRYVRTDSVCHALNAYVRIFPDLEEGELFSLPDLLLEEALGPGETD